MSIESICWICRAHRREEMVMLTVQWPKAASDSKKLTDPYMRVAVPICSDCTELSFGQIKARWRDRQEKMYGKEWVEKFLSKTICKWEFAE